MASIQFIPKSDAQTGDHVREVGSLLSIQDMPVVTRHDAVSGLFVAEPGCERLVPFAWIDVVLRTIHVGR